MNEQKLGENGTKPFEACKLKETKRNQNEILIKNNANP